MAFSKIGEKYLNEFNPYLKNGEYTALEVMNEETRKVSFLVIYKVGLSSNAASEVRDFKTREERNQFIKRILEDDTHVNIYSLRERMFNGI